jgi:hypothetical protein
MARSRRKNGGPRRGTFKLKKLGKGFLANRKLPSGSRPVLRITEPDGANKESGDKNAGKKQGDKPAGKPAKG